MRILHNYDMILDDLRVALSSSGLVPRMAVNDSTNYRLASVLVVIYGQIPTIIMTKKSTNLRIHAGEISFPGGKIDNDSDLLQTALRETYEEIGLKLERSHVIGQLEPVVTLNSGFLILPFVSIQSGIPPLFGNDEVAQIFHIPLEPFLHTGAVDSYHSNTGFELMYTFEYRGNVVWGASARILKQIQDKLLLASFKKSS